MEKEREIWIDVLKGLAIILVVIGHNSSKALSSFIACFHMPLFFLVSGWLFNPGPRKAYLCKTTRRLLIPYFIFLILVSLPQMYTYIIKKDLAGSMSLLKNMIYGGWYLKGIYAVFWFITVLWVAQNLFNFLLSKHIKPLWLVPLIFFSYISYYTPRPLPWNLHVVPMAMVYMWIGFLGKQYEDTLKLFSSSKLIVPISVIIILVIIYIFRESLTFSMKYAEVGIPIISLIISIVASCCVAMIAIWITKWSLAAKILSFIGLASMVIMYLHMPVKFYLTLRYVPSEAYLIHILCGVILSLVGYYLLRKLKLTRKYLLGQYHVN